MKKQLLNITIFILLFISSSSLAAVIMPYGKLFGIITDISTGNSISQAVITITSSAGPNTTVSDINGHYEMTLMPNDSDDPYIITVTANNYETKTINNIVIGFWEQKELNVALSPVGDTIPPVISNIEANANMSDIKNPKVTVKWNTDENATSLVVYWKEGGLHDQMFTSELVSNHNIEITNLLPGKNYYYYVESKDTYGNTSTSGTFTFETKKKYNVTVLLAEPSDILHDISHDSNYYKEIADLVTDYHLENSYNIIDLTFQIKDNNGQWYKLDKTEYHYGEFVENYKGEDEFIEDARLLAGIEKPFPNNNEILIVVHAGNTAQNINKNDAKGKMETAAGKESLTAIIGEFDGIGDWAHEIGHTIGVDFDLYERGDVGPWDLMASGNRCGNFQSPSYMSSFTREYLGWLRYPNLSVETSGEYWINSLVTSKFNDEIFKYAINDSTYYILEARNKSGEYNNKWDISIPQTALVLYYVKNNGKNVNIPPNSFNSSIFNDGILDFNGESYYDDYGNMLRFTRIDEFENPPFNYKIKAKIEKIQSNNFPQRVFGIVINSSASFVSKIENLFNFISPEYPITWPDLDLHLYTEDGKHIGMNYKTGNYEMEIPGAIASGNFNNGHEWIFIPPDIENIHFIVSSYPTGKYIKENQEFFETANINTEDSYNVYGVYVEPSLDILKSESFSQQIPAGVQYEHNITVNNNYEVLVGNGSITIGSLIANIYQDYNLGLIDNNGIKNSLLSKLINAEKKVKENKKQAAINILNSFIAEVSAQYGKHIKKEAADILINNAKKLIELW